MPDDIRTDEQLVQAYLLGDEAAFTELFNRYAEPLWRHARTKSIHKDEPFVDNIRGQVFLVIFRRLKAGAFTPAGPGSFKAWAYKICQATAIDIGRKYLRQAQPFSERYPDGFPDDIIDTRGKPPDSIDEPDKIDEALAELSEEDRQLILIIAEDPDIPYSEIQKIPPFDKYTIPNLRQKTCRLRRLVVELLKEK